MADDLAFEAAYWGDCCNTFDEERKHFVYAHLMGIPCVGYSFDARGASVIDIGGGPVSMLLRCLGNMRGCIVSDPLMERFPQWVRRRYWEKNIWTMGLAGEEIDVIGGWDESWIYNVLQHTIDPEKVVANARRAAKVVRLFEWIDIPPHEGHPHMLTEADLSCWLGGPGHVQELAEGGCFGRSFSGVFPSA